MKTFAILILLSLYAAIAEAKPNILIFVADDLGYGDVSFNGGTMQTKALDKLARSGVILRDFQSSPVCTPSRLGLATGRYPQRIPGFNVTHDHNIQLPRSEETIAKSLTKFGYATALIGKSHIGGTNPLDYGFQYFYGFLVGGCDYVGKPASCGWRRNRDVVTGNEYSTYAFTREALNFISKNATHSWFLQVSWQAPHGPIQGPNDPPGHYDNAHRPQMIQAMDDGTGQILARLDTLNLAPNTIVIFMSDNGATRLGSNGPLRDWKFSVYEGGHRVPAIVRWPGVTKANTVSYQTMSIVDVMPTLLHAVGAPSPNRGFG